MESDQVTGLPPGFRVIGSGAATPEQQSPSGEPPPGYHRVGTDSNATTPITDPGLRLLDSTGNPVTGILQGLFKGALQTSHGLNTLQNKVTGLNFPGFGDPDKEKQITAAETPSGPGQGTGKFLENLAEYMVPAGEIPTGVGLFKKTALAAGIGGTQAYVKSGGSLGEAALGGTAAATGEALFSPAVKMVLKWTGASPKVLEYLSGKNATKLPGASEDILDKIAQSQTIPTKTIQSTPISSALPGDKLPGFSRNIPDAISLEDSPEIPETISNGISDIKSKLSKFKGDLSTVKNTPANIDINPSTDKFPGFSRNLPQESSEDFMKRVYGDQPTPQEPDFPGKTISSGNTLNSISGGKLMLGAAGNLVLGMGLMHHAITAGVNEASAIGTGALLGGIGLSSAALTRLLAKTATRNLLKSMATGVPLGMSDSAAAHLIKDALVGSTVTVLGPNNVQEKKTVGKDGDLQ